MPIIITPPYQHNPFASPWVESDGFDIDEDEDGFNEMQRLKTFRFKKKNLKIMKIDKSLIKSPKDFDLKSDNIDICDNV
ncbi:MAG: hypothetical protein EZS28_032036 [Streblomastix strix]|uniref:Uncharacterized protein n=1 Tax=Streblomastix strix TaxID=222440 RepID=A0A5J4UPR5_9EUKA|nr:MAG: hypothetical protein EZS28_032036 [Streblomastix strix]